MRFFRDSVPINLPVSMADIKMGNRLLMVGCGDPSLFAELALKTGLTGRACALDESEARRARAAMIAEKEGALVETFAAPWGQMPFDQESFDVVVVRDVLPAVAPDARASCLMEIRRVLRGGGRCLVIDSVSSGGFAGLFRKSGTSGDVATHALEAAAFRAVRTLAERDGLLFVEGVKGTDNG
jgi:ubiquinone/menaquinone biosynthesis C-methylase UbiE